MTTTTTRRRIAATATALTLALTLAACSGTGGEDSQPAPGMPTAEDSGSTGAEQEATGNNDADTEFAQMMIVHHEGAVEMAELVVERASTAEVRALGERIAAAQGPEIELMSGWLTAWGEDLPAGAEHGGMEHAGMDMDGMDQEQAMASLAEREGTDLDRTFLELMVAHHRGAIEMAETHLADGQNAEARELAGNIIDAQTQEITEMENLLRGL